MSEYSLWKLFGENRSKVSDKWEQYLGAYEAELSVLRSEGRPIRLLEVGVQNGGSLELWHEYFPEGSICIGLDTDKRVTELAYPTDRIAVYCCDATDREQIKQEIGEQSFDVIIDDGSHHCAEVVKTFELLFERLAPGGKYFIEDLHCSYYADYGGGLRHANSSIEFLKGLIDALHSDHMAPAERSGNVGSESFCFFNRHLARLSFYDSLFVLEKLALPKERPYRRVLSGIREHIWPHSTLLRTGEIPRTTLLGEPMLRQIEGQLLDEVENLRANAAALSHAIEQIEIEKNAIANALYEAEKKIESLSLLGRVDKLDEPETGCE